MRTNYIKIKNILLRNFDIDGVDSVIHKARYNSGLVFRSAGFSVRVELVDSSSYVKSLPGIHVRLTDSLEHDLVDAIQTAEKDGFHVIYVHQKPKADPMRAESLKKSIRNWIKAIESNGYSGGLGSIEKPFMPISETLDSMTEDQLEAVLMLCSACYQKCGYDSRNFRKTLEQEGA
jgi:hypothetical protein